MIEAVYTVDPPCSARLAKAQRFSGQDYPAGIEVAVVTITTYPEGVISGDCVVEVRTVGEFADGSVSYGQWLPLSLADLMGGTE